MKHSAEKKENKREKFEYLYDVKAAYFAEHPRLKDRKRWLKQNIPYLSLRVKLRRRINFLKRLKLPLNILSFLRWVLVDILSGKQHRFWGIYQFVALPGEGKTMSMVAHAERARKQFPEVMIGANFGYRHATERIDHWEDIIRIALEARKQKRPCIIMMDEIHVTFDSSDWRAFPAELLALLSFNRKFELEFLCTSQIYERIPKKVRDIANYTVICKNILGADRWFRNYYFAKDDYEAKFAGERSKAEFIREFIADDDFYALYDTLEQVDQMRLSAKQEKDKRQEAFDLLFGSPDSSGGEEAERSEAAPALAAENGDRKRRKSA